MRLIVLMLLVIAVAPAAAVGQSAPQADDITAVPLPRPRPAPKPETPPRVAAARPTPEPRLFQTACPAVVVGDVEARALPPIADGQCVARSPLKLTAVMVNGREVTVEGDVTTDCAMASMLPAWLGRIDGYLEARSRNRLEAIRVGTSFMCRDRRTGGSEDIPSEHGFADALDVVGFTLDDGHTVTVEAGWSPATSEDGRLLRFAHDAACSLFTTTLGPEANALHRDHFHLDMGCHGAACTYRMCE